MLHDIKLQMVENRHIIIYTSVCCLLTWFIIGMSVYFAGYKVDVLINESLKPCTAIVSAVRDSQDICYYESCILVNKNTICVQVPYTCYDHYASFTYTPDLMYVVNNSTQNTELYLWTNASPTQDKYVVGQTVSAYYNMCPFVPRVHSDEVVCGEHHNITPFFLELTDSVNTFTTAIASLVFVCISATAILLIICYYCLKWCSQHAITVSVPQIFIIKPKHQPVVEQVFIHTSTPSPPSYSSPYPPSYSQPTQSPYSQPTEVNRVGQEILPTYSTIDMY
jgi:hypothetical protein